MRKKMLVKELIAELLEYNVNSEFKIVLSHLPNDIYYRASVNDLDIDEAGDSVDITLSPFQFYKDGKPSTDLDIHKTHENSFAKYLDQNVKEKCPEFIDYVKDCEYMDKNDD
jgi:hypothetical protein